MKQIKQYWYTSEKYTYHRRPIIVEWTNGWDMIHIATRAHVFTGVDVSGVHDAMLEKVMLYKTTHPDEHDCISVEVFEDIWHKALDEARKIYFENQAQV